MTFESTMPKKGTPEHRALRAKLGALVGREFDPAPGKGCWSLVREGLIMLGARQCPDHYADTIGLAVAIKNKRDIRMGDVLVFTHPKEPDRQHVALALGDGWALHAAEVRAGRKVAVNERLSALKKLYVLRDIARPKVFIASLRGAT